MFLCGLSNTYQCSYCNLEDETITHLFSRCLITRRIWSEIQQNYKHKVLIQDLTLQSAYLGFCKLDENKIIVNHILLILKIMLFRSRPKQKSSLQEFLTNLKRVETIEYEITFPYPRKKENNKIKWASIQDP